MLGDSYRNQFRFIKDGRAEMSDRVFYVGAQDKESNVTGYVPAKFLTLNGKPVADPAPGGSQVGYIYADGSDKYKTRGEVAIPIRPQATRAMPYLRHRQRRRNPRDRRFLISWNIFNT
jgi:hypothetical protein